MILLHLAFSSAAFVSQAQIGTEMAPEIRRFQEVIDAHQRSQPETIQEQLITLRARLTLAEKRLQALETSTTPQEEGHLKKPFEVRALKAEMDHYSKKIARLEDSIIQEKRKERAEHLKSKSKSKK